MAIANQKILIIDDHRLFVDGLKLVLSQQDASLCIRTEHNARVLLDDIAALDQYDLIIIDINMPNLNGFDFLHALNQQNSKINVLVMSASEKISDVENALRLGANGFAPKHLPSMELLAAINTAIAGKPYLPHNLSELVDWSTCNTGDNVPIKSTARASELRPRQIEVLKLIQEGHINTQIGAILGISESAVKSHISIIFKALKTPNRTAAVRVATELGLI